MCVLCCGAAIAQSSQQAFLACENQDQAAKGTNLRRHKALAKENFADNMGAVLKRLPRLTCASQGRIQSQMKRLDLATEVKARVRFTV